MGYIKYGYYLGDCLNVYHNRRYNIPTDFMLLSPVLFFMTGLIVTSYSIQLRHYSMFSKLLCFGGYIPQQIPATFIRLNEDVNTLFTKEPRFDINTVA